jgi:transposase
MEILTGVERRRRWSVEDKLGIVREAATPGSSVALVARRHDVCRSQIYQWRRAFRSGRLRPDDMAMVGFLPVEICDDQAAMAPPIEPTLPTVEVTISLRSGRTLRLPSSLPCGEIKRLIAAAETA